MKAGERRGGKRLLGCEERWLRRGLGLLVLGAAVAATVRGQPSQTVSFSPPAATFAEGIMVQLAGAAEGQVIRFVVASGVGAADVQVTAESPIYAGPIAVMSTSLIRAAVFPAGGGAGGRVTSGHYLKVGPSVSGFSSRLPVLVLDVLGAGPLEKDEVNHASWLFGFAGGGGATLSGAPTFDTPLDATVRGSSSAEFPKKGYNVRMRDAAWRSRAVPIFDLPAYDRWALVAPWSFDPAFVNNAFVYELSNQIGRWAPRTRLVELFFNAGGDELDYGDYGGIYVVTDRIRAEAGRVDIERLGSGDATEPAITGGYILQFDPPEEGDVSWRTNRGVPEQAPSEIVLVEPAADAVSPAQRDYIRNYVQQMEDALQADRAANFTQRTYLDYIDRSSWVDHHILNVLANNPDALHRSAYFTKPRNGRLQAGPVWDFDRALGAFWDDREQGSLVSTWSGTGGNVDVWRTGWWGVIAEDPEFVQEWIDRWQSLRRAEFSTAALTGLMQQLADTVGVEAAQRDVARWPDSASPYGSYAAQIDYMKNWLTRRAEWIDAQFVAPPTVVVQGGTVVITPPAGVLLVYTTNGTDPRAEGGLVATAARIHAGSLVVPAGTSLRVRSYDPEPRQQFPWSPWSSSAESVGVSAAVGAGRIVNLSSKASLTEPGETLIVGFVVGDAPSKRFLLRAVGPGLKAFGEATALEAPELIAMAEGGAVVARNAGWETDAAAAQLPAVAQGVGAFPLAPGSADAAMLVEVPSGNFTVQLGGAGAATGVVLGEIYEVDEAGRAANVSIRGRTSEEQPLTGGFVITGGANRVLIRAVGPTLREFGVSDAVGDPVLTLRAGGAILESNDSWLAGADAVAIEEATARVGAFPLPAGSQDAALLVTLPAGAYTVEAAPSGAAGSVLLEIYDVP